MGLFAARGGTVDTTPPPTEPAASAPASAPVAGESKNPTALFDTTGVQTMTHFEALEALFPGDFDRNDPDQFFVADAVKVYQAFTSTKPESICQMMVNGDGRSVLCEVPTLRNGRKFRTSRFITNDPTGVA
jgi:hypothetical protein